MSWQEVAGTQFALKFSLSCREGRRRRCAFCWGCFRSLGSGCMYACLQRSPEGGHMLIRSDSWLSRCPSLPAQIYDWEDLCPVGVRAAQTYLADRQPCRFPRWIYVALLGGIAPRAASHAFSILHFVWTLHFTHSFVFLLRVALNLQPFLLGMQLFMLQHRDGFYKESHVLSNFRSSLKMGDNGVELLVTPYMGKIFYNIILKSAWFMRARLKTWWS